MKAMQEVDDEDDYSDDDLDALPVNTFHELQQNAIRSTQQPDSYENRPSPGAIPSGPLHSGHPAGDKFLNNSSNASKILPTWNPPQQHSSDYGDFDDEMLDGEILDAKDKPIVFTGLQHTIMSNPNEEGIKKDGFRQPPIFAPSQLQGYETNQYPSNNRLAFKLPPQNQGEFDDPGEPVLRTELTHESDAVGLLQAQIQKVFIS